MDQSAGLKQIASEITATSVELANSNARARFTEEARFEALLKSYILDTSTRFAFGGVVNALSSIARICENCSSLEGDEWERASIAIDDFSSSVDFKYLEPRE